MSYYTVRLLEGIGLLCIVGAILYAASAVSKTNLDSLQTFPGGLHE